MLTATHDAEGWHSPGLWLAIYRMVLQRITFA